MQIDLKKTMFHDMGQAEGVRALRLTLTGTPGAQLTEQIAGDLTTMLTQAVNTLLASPEKPAASAPLSQFVGYLEELARVTGALAEGFAFRESGKTLEIVPAKASSQKRASKSKTQSTVAKKGVAL